MFLLEIMLPNIVRKREAEDTRYAGFVHLLNLFVQFDIVDDEGQFNRKSLVHCSLKNRFILQKSTIKRIYLMLLYKTTYSKSIQP
jgi:hypothetical protein